MKQSQKFIIADIDINPDKNEVQFNYFIQFDPKHQEKLTERWVLPKNIPLTNKNTATIKALRAIHLAAGTSYFKTFVPPEIEVSYSLSEPEADFWNEVYDKGLREFRYINDLRNPLANFTTVGTTEAEPIALETTASALVGLGGGKDSIVAAKVIRDIGLEINSYAITTGGHSGQISEVASRIGVENLGIERHLDKRIIDLQKKYDGLNGHIPVSSLFALAGVLLATLTSSRYVVVGNEAGASIPNLKWNGLEINHQWSKSLEFEKSFQNYVHLNISPDITYFSAIRPLSSVAVAKIFSGSPVYFEYFTSCNYVLRIDPGERPNKRWCCECDKCLSSFLLFGPWLSENTLVEVFGRNLLDDQLLKDSLLALLGIRGNKPLNCVGTPDELLSSYSHIRSQGKFADSYLVKIPELKSLPEHPKLDRFLELSPDDAIPSELVESIKDMMNRALSIDGSGR